MEKIRIKDKSFRIMLTEEQILKEIDRVAEQLNRDFKDKNPIFLAVLNGSFMFASDLMKRVTIPCEITFVKLASYDGTSSTGKVKEVIGINEDLSGRTVIVVEDIVESGLTMKQMLLSLAKNTPDEIHICSLFVKPEKIQQDITVDYPVMNIGNDFIVGYGLDYDQYGRNLKDLYVLDSEAE